jgi:hypothetical protein
VQPLQKRRNFLKMSDMTIDEFIKKYPRDTTQPGRIITITGLRPNRRSATKAAVPLELPLPHNGTESPAKPLSGQPDAMDEQVHKSPPQ